MLKSPVFWVAIATALVLFLVMTFLVKYKYDATTMVMKPGFKSFTGQ
jgi:uncharacterized membrane protein